METDEFTVTRLAEPFIHPNDNRVDVHYHVFVKSKLGNQLEELEETHKMRYLFRPEIELFLQGAGMHIIEDTEWMTGRKTGFDTWSVCFVARI